MTALIAIAGVLLQLVLLTVLVAAAGFCAWVVWDITIGPSAQDAAARRATKEGARR